MSDVKTIAAGWQPSRLIALREVMVEMGLDALLVPRWDEQQFEYVSLENERLAWITGFTGSWGLALVTLDEAVLFIDGRYPEQAARETDSAWISLQHLYEEPPESWLSQHAGDGWCVGYDGATVSPQLYDRLQAACDSRRATMQSIGKDPFSLCWHDRPAPELLSPQRMSDEWAGESVGDKFARCQKEMMKRESDWFIETQPDNVNWLLNMRGQDLEYCPVVRARLLLGRNGEIHLFGDSAQLASLTFLASEPAIQCHPRDQFATVMERVFEPNQCIWVDALQGPQCAREIAEANKAQVLLSPSPVTALKSIKNTTELVALRSACLEDSVVWVKLLQWLEQTVTEVSLNELAVEQEIHRLRSEVSDYTGPSFRTISAADGNASLAHYSAPTEGGAVLKPTTLFLLDSGGQFSRGGTTDTTRTWCFSSPTDEHKRLATIVLKSHIAVAQQTFPTGTFGHALDSAARLPMWQQQLDYDHGTGHGVGHYMSVHEFPQRMQKAGTSVGLEAGMTLTVEPGFYRADELGIRHENLCEVVPRGNGWLGLETMAFVPFNRQLIDVSLLTEGERRWIDDYHWQVMSKLDPLLADEGLRSWLSAATRPLASG